MKAITIVTLTLFVTGVAWAQPRNDAKVQRLIKEAKEMSEAGDYDGAINAYKDAYNRSKQPHLLLRIAAEQKIAGLEIESIPVYERYLQHPRASQAQKRKVTLLLADLYSRLSSLRIELDQPAMVSVDGKVVGEGMLVATTKVLSGEHTVLAQREGFADTTVKVVAEPGVEALAQVTMKPLGGEPEPVGVVSDEPAVAPAPAPTWAAEEDVGISTTAQAVKPAILSFSLRAETDVGSTAAGPTAGVSAAFGKSVEAEALALIQRATGLRLAGTWLFRPGQALRPLARVGASVFFEDGSSTAGLHLAGGALWQVLPRVGLTADLAVEHYPDAPGEIKSTAILLSFGARAGVF